MSHNIIFNKWIPIEDLQHVKLNTNYIIIFGDNIEQELMICGFKLTPPKIYSIWPLNDGQSTDYIQNKAWHECYIFYEEKKRYRAINPLVKLKILKRDKYTCKLCNKTPAINSNIELQIDHIMPFSLGGTHDINNLQVLCKSCNYEKSNKYEY